MPTDAIESEPSPIRFALIGCGAAARLYAAPALARLEQRGLALVSRLFDPDAGASLAVSSILPSASPVECFEMALEGADVALIASPPARHREQAVRALRCGLHVFCEKPMALASSDAEEMIATATAMSRLLTVGLVRRHLPAARAIKALLDAGVVGQLRSVTWFEGGPFAWPISSPRYFARETSGGGVLQDIGTHALDLLAWWCGPLTIIEYADDAMGGVEANARLHLRAGEADVRMRLSRDWSRPNLATIHGELGTLEWEINEPLEVRLSLADGAVAGRLPANEAGATDFVSTYCAQLEDLVVAVLRGGTTAVPATAGRDACAVVEQCYWERRPLAMSWLSEQELMCPLLAGGAP